MNKPSIAIVADNPNLLLKAEKLALELHLPFATDLTGDYAYFLLITEGYIALKKNHSPARPLFIDFATGKMGYRQQQSSFKKEALVRALGLNKRLPKPILDLTAGLMRDAYLLAGFGFPVTALERAPIIYTLLHDAIERGLLNTQTQDAVKRITLIKTDALCYLHALMPDERPALIYMDPMFPERTHTALPKQDMLIFHDIVGDDTDADALIDKALSCASERVVVKRPRRAPPLSKTAPPSFSLEGRSSRFDIYLV
jgi:16S rRNA (guanine1516-N2)-methyltransferase